MRCIIILENKHKIKTENVVSIFGQHDKDSAGISSVQRKCNILCTVGTHPYFDSSRSKVKISSLFV